MTDPLHKAEPLAENHKQIWLEPICCVDERCWSQDPQPCDDCDLPSVKYIRADIVEAADAKRFALFQARNEEIERLRALLAEVRADINDYGFSDSFADETHKTIAKIDIGLALYIHERGAE